MLKSLPAAFAAHEFGHATLRTLIAKASSCRIVVCRHRTRLGKINRTRDFRINPQNGRFKKAPRRV